MASFLYFVPEQGAVSPAILERYGLSDRLAGAAVTSRACRGPDGVEGLVIGLAGAAMPGWYPDRQRWVAVDQYHLGVWLDDPPTARDLARPTMSAGHAVILRDEQRYIVPCVRLAIGFTGLSEVYRFDESGQIAATIEDRHRALWDRACRLFGEMAQAIGLPTEDPVEPLSRGERFESAVEALAINYRVGPAEIAARELVDTATIQKILEAAIDLPTFVAVGQALEPGKKKSSPVSG